MRSMRICLQGVLLLYLIGTSAATTPPTTGLPPTTCKDYGADGRFCVDSFDELPEENIAVGFKLYTPSQKQGVDMQFSTALHSSFMPGKPIKFITHGFYSAGSKDWVKEIAMELVNAGDFNVIVVDWESAADPDTDLKLLEYDEASSNTRIVASRVKRLLGFILDRHGSSALNDVHLIGHSLGAQISGMVGKWMKRDLQCSGSTCKAKRITALDPARPNFLIDAGGNRRQPGPHCLSRDDADFVDVIHSDSVEQDDHTGGTSPQLGVFQPLGHADFYPNGGNDQPGCTLFTCDHSRATWLFSVSIKGPCLFAAETCNSVSDVQNKRCTSCTSASCQRMGYHAAKPSTPTMYYLSTTGSKPFCDCADYGADGRFCVDSFDELPEEGIAAGFKLFTRSQRQGVDLQFPTSLHSEFMPGKPIKFITHGFQSEGNTAWVLAIADGLLAAGDFNVIAVDWKDAANPNADFFKHPEYDQASSNTRIVANQIKRLLGLVLERHDSSALDDIHLIGHSLGAQISGMAGKWIQRDLLCGASPCKARRVTALDPARPNFLIQSGERRKAPGPHCVSRNDADFVDVIHSDAVEQDDHTGGTFPQLGIYQSLGHADFYPNGGNDQPGCTFFPCDHSRATLLFAASINSRCGFISERCNGHFELRTRRCSGCTSQPCQRMGFHATKPNSPTLYYLETTGDDPFCGHSLGCYIDRSTSRALSHQATSLSKITIDSCTFYCRGRGYPYAGLQFTSSQSCWCGVTYDRHGRAAADSECSHKCTDAPKGYFCGGNLRNSVYKTGYIGCVQESASNLNHAQFTSDAMFVQYCYAYCSFNGYEYAGLIDAKTCACGNDQSESNTVSASQCSYTCSGNSNEQCGGPNAVSVIRTGIDAECLAKARSGNCEFFDCFNHRHICNEGRRYDLSKTLTKYCKLRERPLYGIVWGKIMECVTEGIADIYKRLPITFSDSTCKNTFYYGKKLVTDCTRKTKVSGGSSRSSSSSSNDVDLYETLKSPDNMADFKASVDEMVAEADSGKEDSVLYLLDDQIDDITRQFHVDGYHSADESLDEMKASVRSRILDMFPLKPPTADTDSSCEELARDGHCDFYSCFDKRYPCGPDGFALSFQKICEGETSAKNYLKSDGSQLMDRVQICVFAAMLQEYQTSENSCKRIEYRALDAYRGCYRDHMDCGFVAANQYLLTEAYSVPAPNNLQLMAQGLIVDTLCDANGTPLYGERNGQKFRVYST